MSRSLLVTADEVRAEPQNQPPNAERLGLLARVLRWQPIRDPDDLAAIEDVCQLARRAAGGWEVERAAPEIFCDQAGPQHVPLLAAQKSKR